MLRNGTFLAAPNLFGLPFAPSERYTCRRLDPRRCVTEEIRYRPSTNINTEAHQANNMQDLDTAAIVHREESGAAVHDFGGSGIRHDCARRVDHIASTLNEYERGIWNVGGETTGSGRKVWANMLADKVPFTEVVREVCIIKKAEHGGLNQSKNSNERGRGF